MTSYNLPPGVSEFDEHINPSEQSVEEPYFIEKDEHGCSECGHGTYWRIVCPDDSMLGQTWSDEETASDICEYMNHAYHAGKESQAEAISRLTAEVARYVSALQRIREWDGVRDRETQEGIAHAALSPAESTEEQK